MSALNLYIAGACIERRNRAPGGWAFLTVDGQIERVVHGRIPETTLPRARLIAACKGLQAIPARQSMVMMTSAKSIVADVRNKGDIWEQNNYHDSLGRPILNHELWPVLFRLLRGRSVHWQHVPIDQSGSGSRSAEWMNRCSMVAREEARQTAVDATTDSLFTFAQEIARNHAHLAGPAGLVLVRAFTDGRKEPITHPGTGIALHPTIDDDGNLIFSINVRDVPRNVNHDDPQWAEVRTVIAEWMLSDSYNLPTYI